MTTRAESMRETMVRCDALIDALQRWRLRREKRLADLELEEAERIARMVDALADARSRALARTLSREGLLEVMVRGAELLEAQHVLNERRANESPPSPIGMIVPEDSGPVHLHAFLARLERADAPTEPPPPLRSRSTPPMGRPSELLRSLRQETPATRASPGRKRSP